MKKWIIPLAVLAVLPAVGAALPAQVGPVNEQLVEGHTVFTVIEVVYNTTVTKTQFAAAVAVLVREANAIQIVEKFPGVLWFNDQYLVDPVDNTYFNAVVRYPCTGAVLAVNQGDPNPVDAFDDTLNGGTDPTYVESYLVTDPNDHQWNVDKWDAVGGAGTYHIWTVAILDYQAGYDQPDNYADSCAPYAESRTIPDQACVNTPSPPFTDPTYCTPNVEECGANGDLDVAPPRCDDRAYIGGGSNPAPACSPSVDPTAVPPVHSPPCPPQSPPAKYNAVLFFFLDDLLVTDGSVKLHHAGAPVAGDDVSGCQTGTSPAFNPDTWPCPAGDDDAEGNSHPYNPFYVTSGNGLPGICGFCIGRLNHGGSAPGGLQYQHATRQIDLYYGPAQAPDFRQYRLVDAEGSTAPYFCEEDFDLCIPNDI